LTQGGLDHYVPDDIPPEVLAYEAEPPQLGVGKSGKIGALALTLDGSSGKTVIKEQYCRVPLHVQRALYLEESLPSMAYVTLISPSEGILQGDRCRIDVALRNCAQVHMTTQSATKVYYMERNYATQILNITLDEGCYLEYVPDQIIPYSHSRFYQKASLKIHDSSTLVYSEVVVPGRVAHGESFKYDVCYLRTSATNQNDKLTFVDSTRLIPKQSNLRALGILGDRGVLGSIYIVTDKRRLPEMRRALSSGRQRFPYVFAGATTLPHDSGILIRALGDSADGMRAFIHDVVAIVRKMVLGAPFSGTRKL
jgi:urease accessory protein